MPQLQPASTDSCSQLALQRQGMPGLACVSAAVMHVLHGSATWLTLNRSIAALQHWSMERWSTWSTWSTWSIEALERKLHLRLEHELQARCAAGGVAHRAAARRVGTGMNG